MREHALFLVTLTVFLSQLGLPVPATPALLLIGAAIAQGDASFPLVVAFTTAVSVLANMIWYWAGRQYGPSVWDFICRVSFAPRSNIHDAEAKFAQWRGPSIILGKMIPGVATVIPPLAGAFQLPVGSFIFYDSVGSLAWILLSLAIGMFGSSAIDNATFEFRQTGGLAVGLVLILLLGYWFFKWWRVHAFLKTIRLARISAIELNTLLQGSKGLLLLDVRDDAHNFEDRIPGARVIHIAMIDKELADFSSDREIVVYCNTPSGRMGVLAARALLKKGFSRVRPLQGGVNAWKDAGFESEANS